MNPDLKEVTQEAEKESHAMKRLSEEIGKVIVGQEELIERLLIALLADGHVLLEGVPGLAKTLTIRTLAGALNTAFQRLQFTPDLLPADIIGTQVYSPKTGEFTTRKGPIFANVILADEINRAPAKVQSALLEAMQERQVTLSGQSFPLPAPFLVMATQNPIEQEGTYPLPEAQVDRFMFKLKITYPNKREELEIMDRMAGKDPVKVKAVLSPQDVFRAQAVVRRVYIDIKVKNYIIDIVTATRVPQDYQLDLKKYIMYGASPRATIYLNIASRANAFLRGRAYVTPEDVKAIGMDVLRHRVIATYEAEAEELTSEDIVKRVFDHIEVP